MPRAMKIFIVTARICTSEDNGVPKRTKRAAETSSRETSPATSTGGFRGVLHTRGVLQNKYRGTVKSAGLAKQREFFSFGALFSRMLPLLARCIIVKMSNRFLRTRDGRRPRSLSSNAIPGLAPFRFERELYPFAIPSRKSPAETRGAIDYIIHD